MTFLPKFQQLFDELSNIIEKEKKEEKESSQAMDDCCDVKELGDNEELGEQEKCMICGDDLHSNDNMSIDISCGHIYHYDCIYEWWCKIRYGNIYLGEYKKRECPYCRKQCSLLPYIEGKDIMVNVNAKKLSKGSIICPDLNSHKCQAITLKGSQCKFNKKIGDFCKIHQFYLS